MATTGFSQSKPTQALAVNYQTINQSKLKDIKFLSDLINDIPSTYTSISYEIVFKRAGNANLINGSGIELKPDQIKNLSGATAKTKMFVDLKCMDKKNIYTKSYMIFFE
jgi:hypothetical protein